MKVLVFGATGGTGRLFMAQAARDHELTAFVRDPNKLPPGTAKHVIVGDARDTNAVTTAVGQHDVVVSLLGPSGRERFRHFVANATRAMMDGMERRGVRRLIVLSAVGVGDSRKEAPGFVRYFLAPLLLRATYADRTKMETIVKQSSVDWTIVRPVYLTNEAATGRWSVATNSDVEPTIARADLAAFLVEELRAHRFPRQAIAIGRGSDEA